MKNKLFFIFVLLSGLFGGYFLFHIYNKPSTHHNAHAIKLPIAHPWRDHISYKTEYVAQITAPQHIQLRSFERGYLQNIYVKEGQLVKKGQNMFQIMPLLTQAQLKKAQAEYQLLKIEYQNTELLAKNNVVAPSELALAKARLDKAKASMEVAQAHFDMSLIKAPFEGIMDRLRVRQGSLIEKGSILTTLSDNSSMWVYFNVSETDYLNYMKHKKTDKTDLPAELLLANGETFSHTGIIDTIEADFDNETGNVSFRATFPNPDRLLRHGETGTIIITENKENALIIPQKATFEILDKKFVYVVDKHNTLQSRQIIIEHEVPHLYVVKSGLDEHDKILLEGIGKIHAGQTIHSELVNKNSVIKSLKLPVE